MTKPGIAALRRRVTLEQQSRAADGGGGVTVTWAPVTDLWASVNSLTGVEQVAGEGLQGQITHEIIIRKRMDVVPAMRFRMGARLFYIGSVFGRDGPDPYIRTLAQERNL